MAAEVFENVKQAPAHSKCIVAATADSVTGELVLTALGLTLPDRPEAIGLVHGNLEGRRVLLAAGSDVRGLAYALLELTDSVNYSSDRLDDLA